ncbi:MAG: hypothetical protein ACJA19_001551 [Bacteroidia bacterium]|jgi:hypothetical protein
MTSKPSKGGQAITAEVVLLSLIIRHQEPRTYREGSIIRDERWN